MPPLGTAAIVIREGQGRDPQMLHASMQQRRNQGLPMCVSVFATDPDPLQTPDQDLLRLCRDARAPWGKVQVSTVERLRDAGFELADEWTPLEAECHFNIYFRTDMTHWDAQQFLACFSEPVPNPVPRTERSAL